MGYRRLLKSYLQHIDQLLGNTLVHTVSESQLFNKRDVGELNGIAAEVLRETANRKTTSQADYSALLAEVIRSSSLSIDQVASLSNMPTTTLIRWCERDHTDTGPTQVEFHRVVFAVLNWQASQYSTPAREMDSA